MPDDPGDPDRPLLDDAVGRMVRPYTVSEGRTRPTCHFDLMTMVVATGATPRSNLGLDHTHVLELCRRPVTVAEIAGLTRMPATVIKVLLSDLVERGAVVTRPFDPANKGSSPAPDLDLLEALRDGLLKRL
ncbi:multi-component regulatory system-3 [Streptomyces hygroscopicus]|uniref:DUF742 domain-containing protein n=1 Tax=Streptomyces hygroscopicus TaxID=1912 RepID=UPI00224078C2|nr:DUF742 domain-containing protein [Streptomyces hygroscopicus]MCW7943769.1 multi-component regulatory system-3 [Streptomyces hygroscopicus]